MRLNPEISRVDQVRARPDIVIASDITTLRQVGLAEAADPKHWKWKEFEVVNMIIAPTTAIPFLDNEHSRRVNTAEMNRFLRSFPFDDDSPFKLTRDAFEFGQVFFNEPTNKSLLVRIEGLLVDNSVGGKAAFVQSPLFPEDNNAQKAFEKLGFDEVHEIRLGRAVNIRLFPNPGLAQIVAAYEEGARKAPSLRRVPELDQLAQGLPRKFVEALARVGYGEMHEDSEAFKDPAVNPFAKLLFPLRQIAAV